MRRVIRARSERDFFVGALGMIVRRNVSGARRASQILSEHFGRNDLAAVIEVATLNNGCGSVLRIAARYGKGLRDARLARKRETENPAYSEMVREHMFRFGSQPTNTAVS
jgi:hypothetical protein